MKCLECQAELKQLDNGHLMACCGLTVQEYALRHHLPLDLILTPDQIHVPDVVTDYPRPRKPVSPEARDILAGLRLTNQIHEEGEFAIIEGTVKGLERMLWDLQWLAEFGFLFRQEYQYTDHSHRVVAKNRLKVPLSHLSETGPRDDHEPSSFLQSLAVAVAHGGELHAGYLFLRISGSAPVNELIGTLDTEHRVQCLALDALAEQGTTLIRCRSREDSTRLLSLLEDHLRSIPGAEAQFYEVAPEATVVKELDFDSAHFITDHPGKCNNLHGGRYTIAVKVKDRIDPMTGFVMDYGYLKQVMKVRVIDHLDHQNLNYVAPELAWRSSTEFLSMYIWARLIDYLPGLAALEIHETAQSYCSYTGPTLEEFQKQGRHPWLTHFSDPRLGRSPLRDQLRARDPARLKLVSRRERS